MKLATLRHSAIALAALLLTACSGGSSTTANTAPGPVVSCDPANSATLDECGTLLVGITDADGDFLNYTVDVLSLTLETVNGRVIEVMPRKTRINFTDYVDVAELVATAFVPPAVYVAGEIHLDYTNAEIFVEESGVAKAAVVTDSEGVPIGQTDLKVVLSNRDQLVIAKRRAHFLQLDFDLEASHEVDITPTPATAREATSGT